VGHVRRGVAEETVSGPRAQHAGQGVR